MRRQSKFLEYIDKKEFAKAQALLEEQIASADYVDPRDDYTYGPECDVLAYEILRISGPEAFARFHEDLLQLFQESLEPTWGHLHKGHFYMRLGLAYLALDVEKARAYFEKGYSEDTLICQEFQRAGLVPDAEVRARLSPNYVSLLVIDRSNPSYFSSPGEQAAYFAGLSRLRMEVFWERHEVDPFPIVSAIQSLIADPGSTPLVLAYQELRACSGLGMTFAGPPMVCSFVRMLLMELLRGRAELAEADGLYRADIFGLVRLADGAQVFPSDAIRSFCQMAAILNRELSPAVLRESPYPIDPVTRRRMGDGLQSLLEKALLEWVA